MTKGLSKSIMERTCLRNTFLKNSTVANKLAYTKTKQLLCITSKKSKKGIFCKPKRKEYHW